MRLARNRADGQRRASLANHAPTAKDAPHWWSRGAACSVVAFGVSWRMRRPWRRRLGAAQRRSV